jgi:hypothetical protein
MHHRYYIPPIFYLRPTNRINNKMIPPFRQVTTRSIAFSTSLYEKYPATFAGLHMRSMRAN